METYNKKEIAHLIVKRLQGELSAEEDALLDAWRKESPRNEGAYHRYQSEAFYRDMHALYTPGEEKSLYKQLRRRLIHRRMKMSWGGGKMDCGISIPTLPCMGNHALFLC